MCRAFIYNTFTHVQNDNSRQRGKYYELFTCKRKGFEVDLHMSEEKRIINIFTDSGGSEDLTTLPDGLTFITSVS